MKASASTNSKEKVDITVNAPTDDAPEEELNAGVKKNQQKVGMNNNVTHSNINNHIRELNYGAGAKDNDTDKMEEYPPPKKKKSRESKKRKKDRKKKYKERSHSPEPESSPQSLRNVNSCVPTTVRHGSSFHRICPKPQSRPRRLSVVRRRNY